MKYITNETISRFKKFIHRLHKKEEESLLNKNKDMINKYENNSEGQKQIYKEELNKFNNILDVGKNLLIQMDSFLIRLLSLRKN